jgi:predicted Zn-dependent protease
MSRTALLLAAMLMLTGAAKPGLAPVGPGFAPQESDERGIWMAFDEAERDFRTSDFVIRDAELNAYVRRVFCRLVGQDACAPVRIYIVRTPEFNASMAPNGMMVVNSGLFVRVRDEAQLAAILGHEYTHYRNRHSLREFRDVRTKAAVFAWLSITPIASYGAAAAVSVAQIGVAGSVMGFSRAMEREADAGSVPLLAQAGYDPTAASRIWGQLLGEMDATGAARGRKSRRYREGGLFASHPPSAERMADLAALAQRQGATTAETGRDAYARALAPWWTAFVDDQVKLNDFGGTDYLLTRLAADGWSADLLYARGELYRSRGRPDDLAQAATFYRQAIADGNAPAEAWRGLGLALLRGGDAQGGRTALRDYLARRPDAGDRAMIAMLAGPGQ